MRMALWEVWEGWSGRSSRICFSLAQRVYAWGNCGAGSVFSPIYGLCRGIEAQY